MKAKITFKGEKDDPEEYHVGSMTEFMVVAFCAFNSTETKPKSVELLDAVEDDSDDEVYFDTIKTIKRAPSKADVVKQGIKDIKNVINQIKKEAGIDGLSMKIMFENKKFSEKDLASIMKLAK